jgi:glycosyltransferase involved in cell wall biosynthesis
VNQKGFVETESASLKSGVDRPVVSAPAAPTLSICIPAYEHGRYLTTAIESALHQTVSFAELLVSDNWSTDNTGEVLKRYAGSARILRPDRHLSQDEHYRFVAENACGDYLVLLGADDALHPRFVESVLPYLGQYTMVVTGLFDCDHTMKPFRYSGFSYWFHKYSSPGQLFPYFIRGCAYIMHAAAIERSWFLALPRMPAEAALAMDWYFALLTSAYRSIAMLPVPRYYYRFHNANTSHSDPVGSPKHLKKMLDWLACSDILDQERQEAVKRKRNDCSVEDRRSGTAKQLVTRTRQWTKIMLSWLVCLICEHPAYLQ